MYAPFVAGAREIAYLAHLTKQSPYDLARLLDEYPDVFDAYWVTAVGSSSGKGQAKQSFRSRRESTRAERIRKAARRR